MRILVYPHDLAMGGSQSNALDLAAEVSRRGHHVVVFGVPGPLVARIDSLGLPFVPSPTPRSRPSPVTMSALARATRSHEIGVLHGYEWPPGLESHLVARRLKRASITTVMSMAVAGFLPRAAPLIVGTRQIADAEILSGRTRVTVMEPPVNLTLDNPNIVDSRSFLRKFDLDQGAQRPIRIVTVARLVPELKLEGLLTAIDVVASLDVHPPVQLVIVGDGPAREHLEHRAHRVNTAAGRTIVTLTGELDDPRPAYRAADIVLGMGGSALRAMAFGKPVVVQGEQGFWTLLDESSVDQFLHQGWYGVGTGRDTGAHNLRTALVPIISDERARRQFGRFGTELVHRRFSLGDAADSLLTQYEQAVRTVTPMRTSVVDLGRSTTLYGRFFVAERVRRLRGSAAVDDFNSSPVAAAAPTSSTPVPS